jgi:hypothetical protein
MRLTGLGSGGGSAIFERCIRERHHVQGYASFKEPAITTAVGRSRSFGLARSQATTTSRIWPFVTVSRVRLPAATSWLSSGPGEYSTAAVTVHAAGGGPPTRGRSDLLNRFPDGGERSTRLSRCFWP